MFLLRSYGRLKGRNLNTSLLESLHEFLYTPDCFNKERQQPIMLDIGCGYGESLLNYATLNPDTICIGCEVYLNGLLNIVRSIKRYGMTNVFLCNQDVRKFLSDFASISYNNNEYLLKFNHIFILFPDPWPKSKHSKRRLVNVQFILLLLGLLVKNGTIVCATDHEDYAKYMNNVFTNDDISSIATLNTERDIISKMFCETRYQKKADGMKIHYFLLTKS